jgi:predicted transcriptional regulator
VSTTKEIKTMTMSSGGGGAMYAFLACTASQFMTPTVITVKRQTTIAQLGALFEQHDFNAFPVMEDGKVLGLVTKFDFLRTFAFTSSQMVPHYDDLMSRRVADVMTEAIVSTPEQKCIGWPERKYISDASQKAPETGVFCSCIRLGSDYLPAYPRSHGVSGACSD